MSFNLNELETWFQGRHKWLQDAAHRLVLNGSLTDQDYSDLLAICLAEAIGQSPAFSSVPAGALQVQDTATPLRLESIGDVRGINALRPTKPLFFGATPMSIVYGRNGAGKSGYVRLLKHACGSRHAGELLGNIFESAQEKQAAAVMVTDNGQPKSLSWVGKPLPELRGVDIYDTDCGLVYVNEENEVAFEPWILRFFSQLTVACETLKQRIGAKLASLVSSKPLLPPEFATTTCALWYANISSQTSGADVADKTKWTSENERELQLLAARLAEANPAARAQALRRQHVLLTQFHTELKQARDNLSDERCRTYLLGKSEARAKRTAADQDAKKVFENAPLSGIGTDSWQLLWEAARKYSEEFAYVGVKFPNVGQGARCVLCQRELNQETQDRLDSFESFVKGELQTQANEAEQHVVQLESSFPDGLQGAPLTLSIDSVGSIDDTLRQRIVAFAAELVLRKDKCLAVTRFEEITTLPPIDLFTDLDRLSKQLDALAVASDEDAKGENRPQLQRMSAELAARKWLSQQRLAIDNEITRLAAIHNLRLAEDLTNTNALSRRKSIIAEELITNAYVRRFNDELKALKAERLFVELKKTRTEVGRVYHRISLRGAKQEKRTSDILSEGEFRIVSLAAFLADTEGHDSKTTFVFDDPISSLDHVFEEATAQRLVNLCKSRQVIVFTHRLSLVGLLDKYCDKQKIPNTVICLSRTKTGEIADLPITLTKTRQAANRLLSERLPAARKAHAVGDTEYQPHAENLCRNIRILLEQVVEVDLLVGVVRRYSAEVQTKNKIEHLAKITPEDCKFVDDLMTFYSRYEHSQPEETPVELPGPDELEKDLNSIVAFIETLQKRRGT